MHRVGSRRRNTRFAFHFYVEFLDLGQNGVAVRRDDEVSFHRFLIVACPIKISWLQGRSLGDRVVRLVLHNFECVN